MLKGYGYNSRNFNIATFWFAVKDAVISYFLYVYLLRLNASTTQISLLEPITAIAGIVVLIFMTKYLDNSKKGFFRFLLLDRGGFLLFAILLFFIRSPLMIIIFYGLYFMTNAIAGALTPNYIKEAIPKGNWGLTFSINKMILIITNSITLASAGYLLRHFEYKFPYNFIIVFFAAALSYMVSLLFLNRLEVEVKPRHAEIRRLELLGFVDKKLVLILLVQSLICMIAPLWAIYHVRILEFSDFQVGLLASSYSVGGLIMLPVWGILLDKISNKKVYLYAAFLMSAIPFIYMVNRSFYALIVVQLFMGMVGNGYDVALQNNLMQSASEVEYDYAYMSNYQIYLGIIKIIFPPLGILSFGCFGIVKTFLLIGVLRVIAAVIFLVGMRESSTKCIKEANI